ncbi:cupin domain-containing protein [Halostagnicola sp. A-GB9-2]|uniref:cupin domain-containing protein n=1 Tax=Halostagnicola sp. A-GB9-2 TaxID=3048066 RepID=UPI0024C036A9|nr:cupin domain-containing protein [Halostagnicola sp. A-GB9-2]MDJ1434766.1 cupin domain-containing protein [Halostagnicola sp. A-GB9-2]
MADNSFISSEDVSTQVFDWGTLKWMATPEVNDSVRFSAGVVQLEPGNGHDLHTHPDSEETLYVINGNGEQTVDGDKQDVGPGDMIHIPKGVEHGTENTGWETLQLLAVYSPPGPEELLAEMPDCEIVPAGEVPVRNE